MLMSPAFSRDTVRESFSGRGGREIDREGGGAEGSDSREEKKNEPTRQSTNLHTAHTGPEALTPRGTARGDDRVISANDS
jgi:hypothetical protein